MAWGARSFNGTNQRANASANVGVFNFGDTSTFSLSVWVKSTQTTAGTFLATWNIGVTSGWVFDLSDAASGSVTLLMTNVGATSFRKASSTATNFNDGNWHNAIVTYDGSQTTAGMLFYIDGVNTATISNSNNAPGAMSNSRFDVGALSPTFTNFLNGSLADAAVWNVKLTASEAAAIGKGARPNTIRPTAMVFWAPLDALQSTEPDLSGNKNVLTLTNAPTAAFGPPLVPFTPRWPQAPRIFLPQDGNWGSRLFNGTSTGLTNSSVAVVGSTLAALPYTVAGWVLPTAGNGPWIFTCNDGTAANGAYTLISWSSAGNAHCNIDDNGGHGFAVNSTTTDSALNTWKHVAATVTSVSTITATTYLNGGGKNSGSSAAMTAKTFVNTGIGVLQCVPPNFGNAGQVAEVGVWNVALTDFEILSLAKGARCNTIRPTALIGYWPCDGLQSPEPDISGKNHNLTLVSTPPPAFGPPLMQQTPRWTQKLADTAAPSFNPAWARGKNIVIEGVAT